MDGDSSTPEVPTMVVGGGTPMACRWNPTKEQINMLEILYLQGLRTPTVEQIQEITTKLQTYGHIEGKNVFYWFQNHKARQRQKEKMDHVALFQQYQHRLQRPQPLIHRPLSSNVVYEHPCYMPHNNVGFYAHHHPQALSPSTSNSTINIRSPQVAPMPVMEEIAGFVLKHHPENVARGNNMINHGQIEIFNGKTYDHKKTLDLFPLHPTGILQERVDTTGNASCIAPSAWTSNSSGGGVDRRYFEFFC